jgi:hypothetical protein
VNVSSFAEYEEETVSRALMSVFKTYRRVDRFEMKSGFCFEHLGIGVSMAVRQR